MDDNLRCAQELRGIIFRTMVGSNLAKMMFRNAFSPIFIRLGSFLRS
jgi:hypothetical protein